MNDKIHNLFRRWIWGNTLGWLLGFGLTIGLALLWGLIGPDLQIVVGISMGAGIGYFQSRLIQPWFGKDNPWLWRSIIWMGLPFALWDISSIIGNNMFFSLPVCVLLGSLFLGISQRKLFPPHYERTIWWIPATVLGWGIPMSLIKLGDMHMITGPWSIIFILPMLFGGVILGWITGWVLTWMDPRSAA